MTIETLRQYRMIASNIEALENEIQSYYVPITSPNGRENVGGSSSVRVSGDPTAEAVNRILDLKDILIERQKEQQTMLYEIEQWLRGIEDIEIESIIRWHFLIGKTWADTNIKVFGYNDRDYCRKRFYRYRNENPDMFQ